MRRRPSARPKIVVVAPASCDMAELLASAGESPDAKLIAACDCFLYLDGYCEEEYRRKAPRALQRIRETRTERDSLEAFITETPAQTALGRCAKAEVAIILLGGGTWANVANSVLRDFQSVAGVA